MAKKRKRFVRYWAPLTALALIFGGAFALYFITKATAPLENDVEVKTDTELLYYIDAKYDGVDINNYQSSDSHRLEVFSGEISVSDKLPKDLAFEGFVTTANGKFGASQRDDTSIPCSGYVIDDTENDPIDEGTWSADGNTYTYHGLHYDKPTHTVTFRGNKIKAGCQLTIGVVMHTPATVDDPETPEVEHRRDFYNTAKGAETGVSSVLSNTVHTFIADEEFVVAKKTVTYVYDGTIPQGAPALPASSQHPVGSTVNLLDAPEVLGYTFSGWQTNDALITDDTFTMPNQDVVLRGSFIKNDNDFKVRYVINGTVIPERYAVPLEHDYAEGAKVKVDSTASGSVFEGYTFSGWSTDDVTISEDGDFTMPNKDVTIEGSFTAPKYEVRYLFNGDSLPENSSALLPQTTQHAEGEAITVAAPVSAEGYIFSGWSKTDFTMPAEDVEIYGEWTKPTGLFAPQISIKLVEDREFLSGETVRFRVTVKNTAAYAIRDVSITEKLTGAKFTAPVTASAGTVNVRLASFDLNAQPSVQLAADTNNYQLIDDTNALIPNIPAGGEVTLPAEYTGTVTARTTLTNPVVMTAAAADNGGGYDLDTSRNYRAEEDFVLTVKGQEQEDNPPTPTPDPEPEPEPQPEPEPETTPAEKPSSPVTLDDVRAIIAIFVGSMTALFLVVRFGFKKKNKIVTGVFIGMLAFAGSGLITAHVMAEDGVLPVAGRYGAESQHISYDNGDPGAWKTQVSYKATAPHEYEVTAEVLSNPINSNGKRDIVLVLDSSRSMLDTMWHANFPTSKADALSNNVRNLTNNILSNSDNRVALISFDTDARIETGFTNNATLIETKMRERSIDRSTNYYRALLKTEELLQDYIPADDTKLIVLFLTDGVPVHDKGMELSVAQRLRARFPDMILNAIQFDVPGDVIPSLKAISDKQYIVSQTEALERTLFHATDIPYYYDHFDFDLRIDSRNYEIVEDSATVTKGTFSIGSRTDYGTEYQMAQWDLGDKFRPGENHTLKFRIRAVGNAATNYSSYNLYDYRSARSSLEGQEDENVYYWYYVSASNYKDIYYNANRYPGDCGVSDSTEYSEGLHHWGKAFVLETVPIERVELYCSGWSWKGWQLGTAGVSQPNDDYFVVPDNNNIYTINIKGTWGKFSLDKRMEGSSNEKITATLLPGSQFKSRVFAQTGATGSFATDRTITTIERAEHLSANVDTEDEQYILSADDSKAKVYGWVDNNKLYVYTDADRIAFNEDASHMFQAWGALTSIGDAANWDFSNVTNAAYLMNDDTNLLTFDGMEKWDTGNVTTFEYAFDDNQKVTSLEPLAGWNTENLSEITNIFYDMYAVESLEPLLNWDTSSLSGSLNGAFSNLRAITNLHGLENWDASRLTDIGFSHDNNLSDISAISGWDVSSAEDITIAYTAVQDFDALSGWQTDSLETLYESFRGNLQLTDISGISSWNTSNVTTFYRAFYDCRKLENIDGLGMGWDTSNVTNMRGVFSNTFMLTDVSELAGWNTSNVTDMSSIFEGSGIVSTAGLGFTSGQDESENCDNLAALQNGTDEQKRQYRLCTDWDVSEVTNLSSAFNNTAALNDLSGLKNWRPIKASNMASIFKGTTALRDVDGVSEWGNLNALTSLASAFESSGVQNLDGLTDWITPVLTNVSSMMKNTANLDDISFLEAWSPADAGAYPDGNDPHLASRDNFNNVNTMASTFSGATALADISPLRNLNVEEVKDMSNTFNGTSSLTSGKAIENWNPAELTNTTQMFFGTHITSLGWSVAGKWNTPKLTNMSDMFEMSLITTAAGLEHLDVSHVTNMGGLFSQARDLADISAIAGWNVSSVTSMSNLLYYNRALTNLDALSSWTPSALKNLSGAFEGTVLTSVEGLRGWAPYVTNVTNLKATFNKGDYTSQVTTFEPINGWGPYLINWEPNPDNWLNGTFWGVDASIRPCWASGDITNCN